MPQSSIIHSPNQAADIKVLRYVKTKVDFSLAEQPRFNSTKTDPLDETLPRHRQRIGSALKIFFLQVSMH